MTIEAHNLTVTANGTLPGVPFLAIKEAVLGKDYDLSIAFLPPVQAREINIARRGKDYIPNTLSFSLGNDSGEIIMCRSVIRAQHTAFDMSHDDYLVYLLIHSMLHLNGFAHGSTMERKEKEFLKLFSNSNGKTARHRRH